MAKNGSKNDVPERRDNHEFNQTVGDTILPGKHDQIVGDWIYGDRQQSQNEEPRESNAFQNNKTRPRQEHEESQRELEDKDRAVRKAAKHESKAPSGDSDTRREQDLSPVNSGAPGRKLGGDPRVPSAPYAGGETPPYRPTFVPPADMQRPGPPIVPANRLIFRP